KISAKVAENPSPIIFWAKNGIYFLQWHGTWMENQTTTFWKKLNQQKRIPTIQKIRSNCEIESAKEEF
ncbi:hypothetical protein, partial [Cylindrospermopsis raciborskii]|uniref:hypothetical protein n=1 Tax=Cylindrospermopsis raciborskii TaxID=77022 RepID=UPI0022C5C423